MGTLEQSVSARHSKWLGRAIGRTGTLDVVALVVIALAFVVLFLAALWGADGVLK